MKLLPILLMIVLGLIGFLVGWHLLTLVPTLPSITYRRDVIREIANPAAGHSPWADLYHWHPDQPCARGYLRIPRSFSRGKQTWDGCWDGRVGQPFRVDFLLPDEEASIGAVVRQR